MFIYSRYLAKQLFWTTLFLTFALTGAVWLTQSLRYIDFVMARGLPMFTFFKLISLLLPNLLITILPISFLIATLLIMNKFYSDNELIVLRALGLSNFQIIKPSLMLALFISGLLYIMNMYIHPLSTRSYKEFKNEIRNNITSFMIQPGKFNSIRNMTFFVKERTHSGNLRGIFIYDLTTPDKPISITAEKGVTLDKVDGLQVILFNGTRQSVDVKTNKPSILTFDQNSIEIKNPSIAYERDRKPGEYFLSELFSPQENITPKLRHKLRVEAHQRLLFPLIIFPFVLLACLVYLFGDHDRRGRSKRLVAAVFSCILLEVLLLTLLNLSDKAPFLIYSAYGTVFLTTLILFIFLLKIQKFKR